MALMLNPTEADSTAKKKVANKVWFILVAPNILK